jgi:hypothetical protein
MGRQNGNGKRDKNIAQVSRKPDQSSNNGLIENYAHRRVKDIGVLFPQAGPPARTAP